MRENSQILHTGRKAPASSTCCTQNFTKLQVNISATAMSEKQLPLSLLCLLCCSSKSKHTDADCADSLLTRCQDFSLSASGIMMEKQHVDECRWKNNLTRIHI